MKQSLSLPETEELQRQLALRLLPLFTEVEQVMGQKRSEERRVKNAEWNFRRKEPEKKMQSTEFQKKDEGERRSGEVNTGDTPGSIHRYRF